MHKYFKIEKIRTLTNYNSFKYISKFRIFSK